MAILRSTRRRGVRNPVTPVAEPEELSLIERNKKRARENTINIDNVVPARPVPITVQPTPVTETAPFLPDIISQDPTDPNKQNLGIQQPVTAKPVTPTTPATPGATPPVAPEVVTEPTAAERIKTAGAEGNLSEELATQRKEIEDRITALNKKLSESPQSVIDAQNKLGINQDQAELDALNVSLSNVKADLLTAQDQDTILRERGRQKISDFAGTAGDLGQLTNQDLRENRLDQLALSRTFSRLGDTVGNLQASINANVKIINDRAKAELAKDQFEIAQNNAILDRVIQAQGNLLSAQQKKDLAATKFEQDLLLQDRAAEIENKKTLLTTLLEKGDINSAKLSELSDLSFSGIVTHLAQNSPASTSSWLDYDEKEAAENLDTEQYTRWQSYNGLDEDSKKEKARQEALVTSTSETISLINDMLENTSGLEDSVGTTLFGSRDLNPLNRGDVNRFRSDLTSLSSIISLDTLKNLKASGATLGAISEKELNILQTAGTRLGLITDKNGNVSGRSNLSESDFKNRLAELQSASIKINILNDLGREEFDRFDIKNKSNEALKIFYNDMKAGNIPQPLEATSRGAPNFGRGNIDLNSRPIVRNQDGTVSTVRSMSFGENGQEVLIPTVSEDGRIMTDDEAILQYQNTGKFLGKFDTPEEATRYAEQLHQQQAAQTTDLSNVDFDKLIEIESTGSYTAVNPTSGAYGKYQFIPSTLNQYANRLGMSEQEAKSPAGQEQIFRAFTNDNIAGLEAANIPVTTSSIYLAHQQGLNGLKQIMDGTISPEVRRNILSNIPDSYADKSDEEVIKGWFDTYLPRLT